MRLDVRSPLLNALLVGSLLGACMSPPDAEEQVDSVAVEPAQPEPAPEPEPEPAPEPEPEPVAKVDPKPEPEPEPEPEPVANALGGKMALSLNPGETHRFQGTQTMDMDMEMMGMQIGMKVDVVSDMSAKVVEQLADGRWKLMISLDKVHAKGSVDNPMAGGAIEFDSADEGGGGNPVAAQVAQTMSAAEGMQVEYFVNAAGETEVGAKTGGPTGGAMSMGGMGGMGDLSDQIFNELFYVLPTEPLAADLSWETKADEESGPMKRKTASKHIVKGVSKDAVDIEITGTVSMEMGSFDVEDEGEADPDEDPQAAMQRQMMQEMMKTMKVEVEEGTVNSKLSLSALDGWFLDRSSEMVMKMTVTNDMMGAQKINVTNKSTLRRLPAGE